MSQSPPVYSGEPVSSEAERLVALFDELEKKQIEFLDEANKRLIELSSALLGLLFGVMAFGDKFPPAYVKDNNFAKALVVLVLLLYLASLLSGFLGVRPREYTRHTYSLTDLREELSRITGYKARYFQIGSIVFFLGSLCLAFLVVSIILGA
jgi:hypothetical protein